METYKKILINLVENARASDGYKRLYFITQYDKITYRITGITNHYDAFDFLADVKKWRI